MVMFVLFIFSFMLYVAVNFLGCFNPNAGAGPWMLCGVILSLDAVWSYLVLGCCVELSCPWMLCGVIFFSFWVNLKRRTSWFSLCVLSLVVIRFCNPSSQTTWSFFIFLKAIYILGR